MTAAAIAAVFLLAPRARAQDTSLPNGDYRATFTLAHPIAGRLSATPSLVLEQKTGVETSFRASLPNLIYRVAPWLEGWGGAIVVWTDKKDSANSRELRPYAGIKVYVPNSAHVHLYDLTRVEWRRITNTDNDTSEAHARFRTRPSVEFPLSVRAWQPKTYYGLANVEALVEHGFMSSLRFASGAGYIAKDRGRIEIQYVAELSRRSSGEALTFTDSSLRLTIKFSLKEGLLRRLEGPDTDK